MYIFFKHRNSLIFDWTNKHTHTNFTYKISLISVLPEKKEQNEMIGVFPDERNQLQLIINQSNINECHDFLNDINENYSNCWYIS